MKNAVKLITLSVLIAAGLAACEKKSDDGPPAPTYEWTWVAGNDKVDQAGAYGTKGTPATTNIPGAREDAEAWTGAGGTFWLFGGYGCDSTGYPGRLNDLWAYDAAASTWTWVSGSAVRDQAGRYGAQGVADPANVPGARSGAASWVGAGGSLWLFGGLGYDATGAIGQMNDLWTFDPAAGAWAWVSGGPVRYQAGVYGAQGVADPANLPGARVGSASWTGADGRFWLFGGFGYDGAGAKGRLNDLWTFDPVSGQWTWVSGSDAVEGPATYGTKGTAAAGNVPGARSMALGWADSGGLIWIFGGNGLGASTTEGRLNDVWRFDPSTSEWAWMSGNSSANAAGSYGTQGTPSTAAYPGARYGAARLVDSTGAVWLFGGYGIDSAGVDGWLNDVWKFVPRTLEWVWLGGSNLHGQGGSYGTKGAASTANTPGARYLHVSWIDAQDRRWVFGGYGLDSEKTGGRLNDLWR
ncbi:MAG TPA: kelch repeat-containing protein [Candidatus Aminicenantes bacterium]|nr:kelch repeat-containing protein [Candidatus Aminicenantes bacterium]